MYSFDDLLEIQFLLRHFLFLHLLTSKKLLPVIVIILAYFEGGGKCCGFNLLVREGISDLFEET